MQNDDLVAQKNYGLLETMCYKGYGLREVLLYIDFVPKLDVNLLISSAGHGSSTGIIELRRIEVFEECLSCLLPISL